MSSGQVTDIKENLKHLERETRDLWHLIKCRERNIDAIDGTVSATDSGITELMDIIVQMEQEINKCTDKLIEVETKREELLVERDELQEILRENKNSEKTTADDNTEDINTTSVETERIMRDDARDTFFQKKDDLERALERKRQVDNQISKEWNTIHTFVKKLNEDRKVILEEMDLIENNKIENLQIARDLSEEQDRDRLDLALEYLSLTKEERSLTLELHQLEFESQYQVNETQTALGIKKKHMTRLEEVMREYHDLMVKDGLDVGFHIKQTTASPYLYSDNDDHLMVVESHSSLIVEDSVDDANTIHHCGQKTDLHINVQGDSELQKYAEEMEKNMAEYMKGLDSEGIYHPADDIPAAAEADVNQESGPENTNDAPRSIEQQPKEPETAQNTPPTARHFHTHTEMSHADPLSMKARMRRGLGLSSDKQRSHTTVKGMGMKATGSGTFAKFRKK